MEAVKIVSQLKDKTDSFSFYGGFNCATVRRGKWGTSEGKGLCVEIDGVMFSPDRAIFKEGEEPVDGSPCKQVLLELPDGLLSIGTDAPVYLLGAKGQTIEAIY